MLPEWLRDYETSDWASRQLLNCCSVTVVSPSEFSTAPFCYRLSPVANGIA